MNDMGQERRLRELEARVRELELRMGIAPAEARVIIPPVEAAPFAPPPMATIELPPKEAPPIPVPLASDDLPAEFTARAKPRRERPAATVTARSPVTGRAMEQTIGLKWAGWVGAVVLVFGAALGIQFAYENHWFGAVPPALRLATIFGAGLALIGTGEWVFRRINVISAASLFGAGVATLFVGAYAGYAYFDIYGRTTSMSLMALSTLAGAAVAMRGNLVSIAVLSLIGANVAPLLVATENAAVTPFLFYLLMMQMVALFLATWGRGGKWWTLRGMSLIPAMFWMAGVVFSEHGHEAEVLAFMLGYAVLYHAELVIATIRNSGQPTAGKTARIGTAFAIGVTAALTLGVLTYFSDASDATRASWVAGLAIVSTVLGLALPTVHDSLRRLAMSHRIAAVALLVLAIPIATGGVRLEIGWMLLAVGFAGAWALTGSPVARVAAPVTWALGLARLAMVSVGAGDFDAGESGLGATWLTIWGTAIGSTVILAWLFSVAGHAIAALLLRSHSSDEKKAKYDRWPAVAGLLATVCGMVWLLAAIAGLPPFGATAWIVVYAWLLLAADGVGIKPNLAEQAGTALLLATVKWAAVDTLSARLSPQWTTTRPLWNPLMGAGVMVAGSLIGFYRWKKAALARLVRLDSESAPGIDALVMAAVVIGLMTVGFSFEIDRTVSRAMGAGWSYGMEPWVVRQLSWTLLWSASVSLFILAVVLMGSASLRTRWIKYAWLPGALLAAKFVLVDTLWQFGRSGPIDAGFFFLPWMAAAGVVAAVCMGRWVAPRESRGAEFGVMRWRVGMLVALLVAWMGTLEIDRFVMRWGLPAESVGLAWHLKNIAWTIWWSVVCSGSLLIWRRIDRDDDAATHADEPWMTVLPAVSVVIALKYLTIDALFWRLMHLPPAGWMVVANLDVLAAVAVIGGVVLPCVLKLAGQDTLRRRAGTIAGCVLLVCATLEVDRAFYMPSVRAMLSDAELAEQVALSIAWSIFAVGALAVGFWRRVTPLRYAALGLLAITLLKVVVLDLSQVGYGYRVLSFLGLGVLLLGTSVMYGKISPKLLGSGGINDTMAS